MMTAKAALVRPLCLIRSRPQITSVSVSFLQRITMTRYDLWTSGRSWFIEKLPFPCSIHHRRAFSTRTTMDSGNTASVESPLIESMEKKIKEHLSAESVVVKDAYGDGRHVSIEVVSSAFEGQSAVNRQRMVYKAIWEELQDRVHAVDQMTTRTPSEIEH
ncbi:hypothetical protein OROGR_032030 [Orobanche gracilis]